MPRLTAVATASALLLSACSTASPPTTEHSLADTAAPGMPSGEYDVLATQLEAPWSIVPIEHGALLSLRDSAQIVHVSENGDRDVIGTVDEAAPAGEGGLLGLALHGDHDDAWLYAYVTTATDNRILRYPVTGLPDSPRLGSADDVLTGIPKASIHNGGRLAFGPDGMLYATTGDATGGDIAQDVDSLAGKILRITPDGSVPDDNPFEGSRVYSLGHRNPQGLAWTDDGRMWASEFGQNTWDELNLIEPGANYGWPIVEGMADDDAFTDPVLQWTTDEASPSGLTAIGDTLYMAGLGGERLWVITDPAGEAHAASYLNGELGRIRDVVATASGSLWLITNNTDGRGNPDPDDDRLITLHVNASGAG
ncbi:PQQ-dependent sugar dehydrogenase [Paramicrobacterium chengjingii]|uniref:PQQ-dependent sugar dehydrogenase n=1 Tax=Paramicrobacterium chengjingii TaxID=2769067 RepID=A0ABX6YL85_9MICO|nr:PQQ-dependent sugar dehydrogenase [Microbacterium chengjingii]QPZ39105.1 PQQ-dependent sugar dehydrogenase [Microbacterium chengjingii]